MFLDLFPSSSDLQRGQLKQLSHLLEKYPFFRPDHLLFGRDVGKHDKAEFDSLFDGLYKYYEQSIEEFGWDAFFAELEAREPIIPFLSERKDVGDRKQIITRVIAFDLSHFDFGIDDFVGLPDNAYAVHQSLSLQRDRYDMVTVDQNFDLRAQGIIYANEHLIFYHPFLRRFFRANFTEITAFIRQMASLEDCILQVAIDPFRVNRKAAYAEIIELDHWWGPKFDQLKLNDPYYAGKTIYKRLPSNRNNWTLPVDRIEVSVTQDGSKKEFRVEEITVPPSLFEKEEYKHGKRSLEYSKNYRLNKFAHFIWDSKTQHFCHLDVAVIVHDLSRYEERFALEHPERNAVPKADKVKLVRVDGLVPQDVVERLCTDFFRYNELIGEFFEGK